MARKKPIKDPSEMTAGEGIVAALNEVLESQQAGEQLEDRFTVCTVALDLAPSEYTSEDVKHTRERLGASQPVFAEVVGVTSRTVKSWEQGKTPSKTVCRLLDLINEDPDRWVRTLRGSRVGSSARAKTRSSRVMRASKQEAAKRQNAARSTRRTSS